MKLLANENFPLDSVVYLKQVGYDIIAIGVEKPSITDEEVMKIAKKEKRLILTFDRDYGELIFKFGYKPQSGVIFLRLEKYKSDEPGKVVEQLLASPHFNTHRKLTVFDGKFIRQRSY